MIPTALEFSKIFRILKAVIKFYAHVCINKENKTSKEWVELFWDELDDIRLTIPDKHNIILLGDFNAEIGREKKV